MKSLYISTVALLMMLSARAQQADSVDAKPKSSLTVSLDVASTQAMNPNRTTYTTVGSFAPGIIYSHKSGFSVSATTYLFYGNVSGSRNYKTDLSGSYNYDRNENFDLGLSYTAQLFNKNSAFPKTPLNNDLYAHIGYNRLYVNPELEADYGFGSIATAGRVISGKRRTYTIAPQKITGHDISLFFNLSHNYYIVADRFSISPKLSMITGTENYFQNARFNKSVAKSRISAIDNTAGTDGAKFKPRYIGTTFYADYAVGKFDFSPSYSLTLPIYGSDKSLSGYLEGTVSFKVF